MKPVCAVLSLDARFELRAAGDESSYTSTYPWCNDVLYLKKTGLISCLQREWVGASQQLIVTVYGVR